MRRLRPADELAPPLGQTLGRSPLLLGRLPAPGQGAVSGRLFLILGDQLHPDPHPLLVDFDRGRDRLLMVEAPGESTRVPSHRARTVLFLSAMRHRAQDFRRQQWPLTYLALGEHAHASIGDALTATLGDSRCVVMLEAGDARLQAEIDSACQAAGTPLLVRPDPHFLCSLDDFGAWAGERDSLRLEFFYRWQRRRHGILMDDGAPTGGRWNFDADNRQAFGSRGPGLIPAPLRFPPDAITRQVIAEVSAAFPELPGSLDHFAWPVTAIDAEAALADFIHHRLPDFGRWQDAMWPGQPFLWHSLLSPAMNLKLLDPRRVIAATLAAWESGAVPLAAAEGFIRQILGWREFVRGIYGRHHAALAVANQYGHDTPLPAWFWSGDTGAACLADIISQTLREGYAHHIQRLMVTGNFALIAGLAPRAVADWYLGIYVDAVAWVEEPNTLGMALNAWPGMTSKPYCASGAYLKRMSDHCRGCRYRPERRTGPQACPFTNFYWDFLLRHRQRLAGNPRMSLAIKHLDRLDSDERREILTLAGQRRRDLDRL